MQSNIYLALLILEEDEEPSPLAFHTGHPVKRFLQPSHGAGSLGYLWEDPHLAVNVLQCSKRTQPVYFQKNAQVMHRPAQSHNCILHRGKTNFIINMDDTRFHKYFSRSLLNLEQLEYF